ncbi:dihydroxy-acid dehydratase [Paraburkholderia sabiae]|uniref:Dihydroxy-acid dehydratase n=1 Tax=Paraburkholderia sabiae TaxID=273251 RepID=A0ABU9QHU9_9BURK|nr:dihydroxy-acid dehydratase [Paraburkholderia sabiae]WJZ77414.1 dihydroxy-acid dehydratase [Paraburkholderia sabiae]CAD6557724.1 Dihydroxy-acid dehydratase [Paraburkholderia sabiae]
MTKSPLRSIFAPGSTRWAVRRAQWKALGLSDEDFEKPKIAIVNTSSELSSCFSHLDGITPVIKEAIRKAGGVPFEIRTAAPSDFITAAGKGARYILPSRDLVANDIEVAVEGALLDGMICLASCDKTAPGQLMAAARINIPSLFVICGYQGHGVYKDHEVDIEEVFESVGKLASGGMSLEDLTGMCDVSVSGPGVCSGMGTANSMHMVCEALGMCLPGNAPVRANSQSMFEYARRAGERIVGMVHEDLKPRDIMTPAAFENAVALMLAASTSINCVRHLQAIADEAGLADVDLYEIVNRLGKEVPLLVAIRPNGTDRVEALEAGGGARGLLKRLQPLLHTEAHTATGGTLKDDLEAYSLPTGSIIRPLDAPLSRQAALVVMRGSLAPLGALLKLGTGSANKLHFKGPARVFHTQDDAITALGDGRLQEGDVAVLRYLGPKGGPGLAYASWFVAALEGSPLSEKVAVVTDGQLSGLNRGIACGQIAPEAAEGGPLALIENGDTIEIDVGQRSITLLVEEAELARRREELKPWVPNSERGWLSIYQRLAKPIYKGSTLTPE